MVTLIYIHTVLLYLSSTIILHWVRYKESHQNQHTTPCTNPVQNQTAYHMHIPYLSVLKLGSNTRRGSNICRVVQQKERNKHLGLFKRQVPKLLKFNKP